MAQSSRYHRVVISIFFLERNSIDRETTVLSSLPEELYTSSKEGTADRYEEWGVYVETFLSHSLSLSYYRFFFSLFLSFALSPISTRTRLTKMYIRDADSKIFARFRKLEAVCLLKRCSFDSRPIRGREREGGESSVEIWTANFHYEIVCFRRDAG